jgi:hypothetical protein
VQRRVFEQLIASGHVHAGYLRWHRHVGRQFQRHFIGYRLVRQHGIHGYCRLIGWHWQLIGEQHWLLRQRVRLGHHHRRRLG